MSCNSSDCVRRKLALLKEDLAIPMPDTIQLCGMLLDPEGNASYTENPWADYFVVQAYQHVDDTGEITDIFTADDIKDESTAQRILKQLVAAFPNADVVNSHESRI